MFFGNEVCRNNTVPSELSWTTAGISVLLTVITVPGNLLIAIAIIKDPYHKLRTPFNIFVINLVIADLIVGSITEPTFVVYHIMEAKFGKQLKDEAVIVHVTYFCSLTASLISIAVLAVDRCQAITCSYVRTGNVTKNAYKSVVIWLISLTLPWVILLTGFYLFAFVYVNTAILVSLIIIVIAFCRVKRNLHGKVVEWSSIQENTSKIRAMKRERVLTNSFIIMLTSFCLCLTPSFVMAYVINFCVTCSCDVINWLRDFHFLFPLVNSAANQFLYPWRMRNFRKAVCSILRCKVIQWDVSASSIGMTEMSERRTQSMMGKQLPEGVHGEPILSRITMMDP